MMLSVIIDIMDQSTTKIPYFQDLTNPLETCMVCKPNYLVHGLGYHLFFSTCQVQTRTNLAIKVLRRTLKNFNMTLGFSLQFITCNSAIHRRTKVTNF